MNNFKRLYRKTLFHVLHKTSHFSQTSKTAAKLVLLFQCPRHFVSWICSSVLCAAVVVRRDIWSLLREYLLSHWKVKTSWDAHLIWQMFFHQICWIKIYHHKWKNREKYFLSDLYEMMKWQKLVISFQVKVRNRPKWKENIIWQKYLT